MWVNDLLEKYFAGESLEIVRIHSTMVAEMAMAVCSKLGVDSGEQEFIEQAALLHDIGVSMVNAPKLGLSGSFPYIMHGILGRDILEREGYPRHGLVCERHIGVGLTLEDIQQQNLPLPLRDMIPLSISERIICYADLFYSKKTGKLTSRKTVEKIRENLSGFGKHKLDIFNAWHDEFKL